MTEAAYRYSVPLEELERWRQRFLQGAERALASSTSLAGLQPESVHDLHARIGAQAVEIENLKRQLTKGNETEKSHHETHE
jgi:hypothetical protein